MRKQKNFIRALLFLSLYVLHLFPGHTFVQNILLCVESDGKVHADLLPPSFKGSINSASMFNLSTYHVHNQDSGDCQDYIISNNEDDELVTVKFKRFKVDLNSSFTSLPYTTLFRLPSVAILPPPLTGAMLLTLTILRSVVLLN